MTRSRIIFSLVLLLLAQTKLDAQLARSVPRPVPRPTPTLRRATDLIHRQEPINVSPRLLEQLTPDNSRVRVSFSKQRAYLLLGDEVVVDSPISSGKRARPTPTGNFHVLEKDKGHHSSVYGDFCDSAGRIVRRGVSLKDRFRAQRHSFCRRGDDMVHAPDR